MMGMFDDDRPWFAPKRYGLGSGLPVAWQGWLMLALHVALIAGVAALLSDRPLAMIPLVVVVALLPFPLYAAKTRGGWRWRWGGEE